MISPVYEVREERLTLRPYQAKLTELTQSVCAAIEGEPSERCLFEARTAFDCVLRHKVRQFGSETDNIGACKSHIDNMKSALGQSSSSIIDS